MHLKYINSFNPHCNFVEKYCYFHYIDKEIEVQNKKIQRLLRGNQVTEAEPEIL